jgi:hypothetical protein
MGESGPRSSDQRYGWRINRPLRGVPRPSGASPFAPCYGSRIWQAPGGTPHRRFAASSRNLHKASQLPSRRPVREVPGDAPRERSPARFAAPARYSPHRLPAPIQLPAPTACADRGCAVQARDRDVRPPRSDDHLRLRLARQLRAGGSRRLALDGAPPGVPHEEAVAHRGGSPRAANVHGAERSC